MIYLLIIEISVNNCWEAECFVLEIKRIENWDSMTQWESCYRNGQYILTFWNLFSYAYKLKMIIRILSYKYPIYLIAFRSENVWYLCNIWPLIFGHHIGVPRERELIHQYGGPISTKFCKFPNIVFPRTWLQRTLQKLKFSPAIHQFQLTDLWVCWCFWCKQKDLVISVTSKTIDDHYCTGWGRSTADTVLSHKGLLNWLDISP